MNKQKLFFILLSLLICTAQSTRAQSRKISKGDILEIIVYNRAELSKTVIVQENGNVDYPFVSNIPIDALTLDEFRDLLVTQVAKYTGEAPIITVRSSGRLSIQLVVLGQVRQPGEILVPKNATLQGALTMAGGPTSQAELNRVKIIRGKEHPKDTLYVDLYDFSLKGDPGLLPPLQEGDVIFVPGLPGISDVKVIGEVKSPGNLTVPPGTSLLDVLYLAGGPTTHADLNDIRLYDAKKKKDQRVYLNKLIKESRFDEIPTVSPGNVIVIETKHLLWKDVIEGLRLVTSVAVPIVMILYYSGVIDRR
ncbi:SLBB domain-containing protein [bacterium]|nr:SLBB domain-containing protein [bacterium]